MDEKGEQNTKEFDKAIRNFLKDLTAIVDLKTTENSNLIAAF